MKEGRRAALSKGDLDVGHGSRGLVAGAGVSEHDDDATVYRAVERVAERYEASVERRGTSDGRPTSSRAPGWGSIHESGVASGAGGRPAGRLLLLLLDSFTSVLRRSNQLRVHSKDPQQVKER